MIGEKKVRGLRKAYQKQYVEFLENKQYDIAYEVARIITALDMVLEIKPSDLTDMLEEK